MPGQQIRLDITRTQSPIGNKLVLSYSGIAFLNVIWKRDAIYGAVWFYSDYANFFAHLSGESENYSSIVFRILFRAGDVRVPCPCNVFALWFDK